ncbi:MAG: hypothetical protein ACKOW5_12060 [Actinomycetales bacterium]
MKVALNFNAGATTAVMGVRRWGDADLHIALWGAVTLVVLWAARSKRSTTLAVLALLAWSACTEVAQPWFTEHRTRQGLDFVGNAVGILLATGVVLTVRAVHQRRHASRGTQRAALSARA